MRSNLSGRFQALLAVAALLLGAAVARGQEVAYTSPGIISITGVPMIYNGKYAIQKTDFGFLWLDTQALLPGIVQVEAKCGLGQPYPATGIFVLGDCNGITSVSSSGDVVVGRQYSGQCGAATQTCGGGRVDGTGVFGFRLGTWEYLGNWTDIPDSTQTADLQGRTWLVQALDTTGRNFKWKSSGNPNAPPTANATATNLSAAARIDQTNYYGDKWQLQDASITVAPLTRIDWDFNYKTSFSPNETGSPASESSVIGYFPCDPSGPTSGNIRTGASCIQSLGLTNPAATGTYRFAMQSANSNGTSASPYVSPGTQVVCPEAFIAAYAGYSGTCAKTGGTLSILVGGTADATASEGNTAEASFAWAFTGSGTTNLAGGSVTVPSGATGFTLTITYPGGYKATAQGTVSQANFVAGFSAAPNPVLANSAYTLTNQMQKTSSVTLNSVNYVVNPGSCNPSFNSFASAPALPASFLTAGGTASLQSPATTGSYCVYLKFNYTAQTGPQQSQIAWTSLSVSSWTPSPQISITPAPFCFSGCQLQAGTSYTLSDSETILVSPHPPAQWDLLTPLDVPIATSSDASAGVVWTPTTACSSCQLQLTVNGVSVTLPVNISGSQQQLAVGAQGPTSGQVNTSMGFSATAAGGASPYGYWWSCDADAQNPVFTTGGSSFSCSWTSVGTHSVRVKASDMLGSVAYSSPISVTIAGVTCGVFTDIADASVCPFVLGIANAGITNGCTPTTYCPNDSVFRLQMAVFLARAQSGGDGYVPASGMAQGQPYICGTFGVSLFSDIAPTDPFCRHVHKIYATGVTTGTSPGVFSPAPYVSRAQMGMFIARAIAGSDAAVPLTYGPDPATGRSYSCDPANPNLHYTDVTTSDLFCRHTNYLWAKGVDTGVYDSTYQPSNNVTRAVMAKFLATGFKVPM
ncbi:MAG TPA: S-layer homology domain-containing protein [Thermoanaerobaculia bacterium]|nr:S-layer homology domain-containing protein [Thermoanaerobaculia bacterium]